MAKKIGYNKFTEFENAVYKLQDICKKLEIIKVETTGVEEALWFFQNLVVRKPNNVIFGYSIYIPDRKELTRLHQIHTTKSPRVFMIHG
jgi:hypothetical protein